MTAPSSAPSALRADQPTSVELTWIEQKIEHWIAFGHTSGEQIQDRAHRTVYFNPGAIFAFVRWMANDFGTIVSEITVIRTVSSGEPFVILPHVRPGGEVLLKIHGWPKVQRVLVMIDSVAALDIDPADASPDYWRHVHNRLVAGFDPSPYSRTRHLVWRLRRRLA
ncbi:MAG TPA: DUF2840 domain-containing protein [Rhizomicrobium sp.]|jgi:hypothetical protein